MRGHISEVHSRQRRVMTVNFVEWPVDHDNPLKLSSCSDDFDQARKHASCTVVFKVRASSPASFVVGLLALGSEITQKRLQPRASGTAAADGSVKCMHPSQQHCRTESIVRSNEAVSKLLLKLTQTYPGVPRRRQPGTSAEI